MKSVRAVTVGKAPPFPYSPLHSGVDLYNDSEQVLDPLATQNQGPGTEIGQF